MEPARQDLALDGEVRSQRSLSKLIDAANRERLIQDQFGDLSFRAHMGLVSLPGASAWLTAPPAEDREMDAPLFRVAVKRRLRMPLLSADVFCPACGDCLDRFCDHAIVCPCKGDKTLRHNAVAGIVYSAAKEGAMRPEKERSGLLPPRPQEDGVHNGAGNRRPADVWIPQGRS